MDFYPPPLVNPPSDHISTCFWMVLDCPTLGRACLCLDLGLRGFGTSWEGLGASAARGLGVGRAVGQGAILPRKAGGTARLEELEGLCGCRTGPERPWKVLGTAGSREKGWVSNYVPAHLRGRDLDKKSLPGAAPWNPLKTRPPEPATVWIRQSAPE